VDDDGRVIYEVNLTIDPGIVREFDDWLTAHVAEMLALPGFRSAKILSADEAPMAADAPVSRTTLYVLDNRAALEHYLTAYAGHMRADGVARFGERFKATRRILEERDDGTPSARCLNCQSALTGQYCGTCGQRATSRLISLWQLSRDALGDLLDLDSRVWRTLAVLVRKPGLLTAEYLNGRRARYMPPFRMYLILSLLFFLIAFFDPTFGIGKDGDLAAAAADGPVLTQPESGRDGVLTADSATEKDCEKIDFGEGSTLGGYLSEERAKAACRRMVADNFHALKQELIDHLPMAMFVFLPLLALVMKFLYPLSRRYYVEHLLFVVHFQSLGFLVYTALLVLDKTLGWSPAVQSIGKWLEVGATVYVPVYLYLAMRRVYGQGRIITFLKYVPLVFAYFGSALIAFLAALLLSVLSV